MIRPAALAAVVLLAGCASESRKYRSYPENPFPGIRVVAVLPFMNHAGAEGVPVEEFGEIFASEILKFGGFRVIRPRAVSRMFGEAAGIRTFEEAKRLGSRLKADAVLVAAVTDYDPYRPPRLGLSVQFFRIQPRDLSDTEVDRIVQSASWRRGPLHLEPGAAGHWVRAFERVFDAHQERIRRELTAYGKAHAPEDSPFRGDGEFLAVQSRFMQFVSNQVFNDVLELPEGTR